MEAEGGAVITKKKRGAQKTANDGDVAKEGDDAQKEEGNDCSFCSNHRVEEEEEERRFAEEKQLTVLQFIRRIATNKIINLYLFLLMDYATNDQHVNHVIIKFLTFVARECKLYAIFLKVRRPLSQSHNRFLPCVCSIKSSPKLASTTLSSEK